MEHNGGPDRAHRMSVETIVPPTTYFHMKIFPTRSGHKGGTLFSALCIAACAAICLSSCVRVPYRSTLHAEGWQNSLKIGKGAGNPLLDFTFTADPTAIEYGGRLYVYGTNDHQQFDSVGVNGKNSYEKIRTLAMMSTEDMVNWTWHGLIPTGELAPWIIASWAPSVVSRIEEDGLTHFYLYFSNSGYGSAVLTSTSPVGPWTSPLGRSIVDTDSKGLDGPEAAFDPGAVIDESGVGWLSFGGGAGYIVRLGKDLISCEGDFIKLPAAYHFEANELNFIDGTYVYTYNMNWTDHKPWTAPGPVPVGCCMTYMTSKTPLDPSSWEYGHDYFPNPGDFHIEGIPHSNNHTHLHQYKGKWYLLYHNMDLQNYFGTGGGFRNICVDQIEVVGTDIRPAVMTREGVPQVGTLDPFSLQQIETVAGTINASFEQEGAPGNTVLTSCGDSIVTVLKVRGVDFGKGASKLLLRACGQGTVEVRTGSPEGPFLGGAVVDMKSWGEKSIHLEERPEGIQDLFFLIQGEALRLDSWKFK